MNLFDEGRTEIDNSGMTVRIEGASIQATTDATGEFRLEDVAFGTYTLIYEKSGYGTFKKFDIEHNSLATFITENPSLGQISSTSITELTSGTSNSGAIVIGTTQNPEANIPNPKFLQYFFSTQPGVSNTSYDAVLETIESQITPYNLNLTLQALEALGFQSGQTVYVKCYGTSFWGNQYDDPDLGTTVFPNLNTTSAQAVSFVVP